MRRPIIAGNWKMNMTREEAENLILDLIPKVVDAECDVVICPPACFLETAGRLIKKTNIRLGCQNVHWADKGAFTGEISAAMLKSLNVEYAIIGHSERRQYFGETDELVNSKVIKALQNGITPIICVGESLDQRRAGETDEWVRSQVRGALKGLSAFEVQSLVIAYEPIWAIGTGVTATSEQAGETIGVIRTAVKELFDEFTADKIRIQYGGSMNPGNAKELMSMPGIDGGLIGGASLKADDFAAVVLYSK
ncbi:MAG: Triosephosphate isomerase [Firmicutes bacterium ADurb.Bin182]|nr:MAG: Triosephosphate isomerase [Firmicutes bacterium ADurb.Bin182]